MDGTLTLQQLRTNSYHLAIRSSLLAIQSTLSLQEIMLQSQHTTFTDIKSMVASQNTTLQNTTKKLVEFFSKISSYQSPSQLHATSLHTSTTATKIISTAASTATAKISTAAPLFDDTLSTTAATISATPQSLLPCNKPPTSLANSNSATSQPGYIHHPPALISRTISPAFASTKTEIPISNVPNPSANNLQIDRSTFTRTGLDPKLLKKIIARDFFPDISLLRDRLNMFQGLRSGDPVLIREARLKIDEHRRCGSVTTNRNVSTNSVIRNNQYVTCHFGLSATPWGSDLATRANHGKADCDLYLQSNCDLSLDESFSQKYTGEDNESFHKVFKINKERKEKLYCQKDRYNFLINFYLLNGCGTDVAFDIHRLQTLGLDHLEGTSAFNYNKQPIVLSGLETTEGPTAFPYNQYKRLKATSSSSLYLQMEPNPNSIAQSPTGSIHPKPILILTHYASIFDKTNPKIFTMDIPTNKVDEMIIFIGFGMELEAVNHIVENFAAIVKSCDDVSILSNLSDYDDAYLSYSTTMNPYVAMLSKFQLLVVPNFNQTLKGEESDCVSFLMSLVECPKMFSARKNFIFDPGGTFYVESV